MTKEQKFYNALRDIFVGAKIEGESGFVNLMRIKSGYFEKINKKLQEDTEKALSKISSSETRKKFKDELFDKLYSFFSRYFTRSGSIYFNQTPFYHNIYEKVYTDEKDVILFWKTHMLYYVKSDRIFKNLEVAFDLPAEASAQAGGHKFFFDVSKLEHKRANEKRSLVYQFKNVRKDETIVFEVFYSEKGRITKIDEIKKGLKKKNIKIKDEDLERSFRIFEKQSEVDYFINKNAKEFLKEQFKLWLYQYVYAEESEWPKERIDQLQILKDIANKIIDFIAQFEDELVEIWNKPKFVKNSNYVITLDRIRDPEGKPLASNGAGKKLVEKIRKHKNFPQQVKEWKELGIAQNNPHASIDTKYFKDLELEILGQFDDLDKSLDGWLIKSENYQALNTILPKFKEQVQTIYIDPPFNKKTDADYFYSVKYKDATWVSLLENRLEKAKDLLNEKGSIFVRCDYNGNMLVRLLMDKIFGQENFRNEIDIKRNQALPKTGGVNLVEETENLYSYAKSAKFTFLNTLIERDKPQWVDLGTRPSNTKNNPPRILEGKKFYPSEFRRWSYSQENIEEMYKNGRLRIENDRLKILLDKRRIGSNWTDIPGYSTVPTWGLITENSEKLLKRVIEFSLEKDDLVLDFFLGSGTTTAVAHKLGRKWLGVEMGEHFYSVVLPRMKKVLAYDKSGISKEIKEYQGGGFFKYYELEQYEDVLRRAKYEESTLFEIPDESPYQFNPFIKDKKLLEKTLEIDYKNNKVKVDLSKLYPDIDIAETLSNLRGKYIKKITKDEVEFEDGEDGKKEKFNLKDLDYKIIKPLIWW